MESAAKKQILGEAAIAPHLINNGRGKRWQDSLFGCRRRYDGADRLVSARTDSERKRASHQNWRAWAITPCKLPRLGGWQLFLQTPHL